MPISFSDIENAYDFVSFGSPGDHCAYLCKETGKIYYTSELGECDELPEDIEDEKYIEIPTKRDLRLGKDVVLHFAAGHLPDELYDVNAMFHRHGAYSRFKALLKDRGLLQQWYDYEAAAQVTALKRWCEANGITVSGEPAPAGDGSNIGVNSE